MLRLYPCRIPLVLKMSGSVVGCWHQFPDKWTVNPVSGVWHETGTEEFIGCLATGGSSVCGSLFTAYRFEGNTNSTGYRRLPLNVGRQKRHRAGW